MFVTRTNMEQTGSEKVVNRMNVSINLLILTTAVRVQLCELLIYRSSSTMFTRGDDVTYRVTSL